MTQIRHTRPRGCPFLPSFQGTHGSQLGKQPFGNGERLLDVVLQYLHVFTLTMEPGASDPATDEGGIEGTEELAYKPPESQMISNLPEPNDYTCQFVRTLNHCITAWASACHKAISPADWRKHVHIHTVSYILQWLLNIFVQCMPLQTWVTIRVIHVFPEWEKQWSSNTAHTIPLLSPATPVPVRLQSKIMAVSNFVLVWTNYLLF